VINSGVVSDLPARKKVVEISMLFCKPNANAHHSGKVNSDNHIIDCGNNAHVFKKSNLKSDNNRLQMAETRALFYKRTWFGAIFPYKGSGLFDLT